MFFNMDKKQIYTILGIVLLLYCVSIGTQQVLAILLTLPGVIVAITCHEFAHAYVADKLGDTTPRNQGRLTLDPKAHLDPFGFVLMIVAHIGWGKPVQINPNNFMSNKSKSTCEMLVSLAGPATNFLLALLFTIILYTVNFFGLGNSANFVIVFNVILYAILVNIGLCIFNLIPIPPLDGEKIFKRFLPYKAVTWLDNNEQMLNMVFIILWITGILGRVVSPIINLVYAGMINSVGFVFTNIVNLFV